MHAYLNSSETMPHFSTSVLLTLCSITSIGCFTTGLSIFWIRKSFNVQKGVFSFIAMDNVVSFCSCFVQSILYKSFHFVNNSYIPCCLFMYLPLTSMALGYAYTALIAIFRFIGLIKSKKNEEISDGVCKRVCFAVTGVVLGLELVHACVVIANGMYPGSSPEVRMYSIPTNFS